MDNTKTTKRCSKCGGMSPTSMFYKKTSAKDGLQNECIECRKKIAACHNSKKLKIFLNPELAKFQPRELIAELKARGYSGELFYTQKIVV